MLMVEEETKKGFSKKDWVLALGILVVIIGGAGSFVYFKYIQSHNPIPSEMRQDVSFTPYYPAKLPHDWHIDNTSFFEDGGAIIYKIKSKSSDTSLSFSIQPQPGDFDFKQFYKNTIKDSISFPTPHNGKAVVGTGGGKAIGSLQIDDTWVLVSAITGRVSSEDIKDILLNLES